MRFNIFFFLPLLFLCTSCSIYQSRFEKGDGLTTEFLNRIQENPNGEDILLPPKEKFACKK